MLPHTEIINYIIKKRGFSSYLEIGINNRSKNFDLIDCRFKIGVDPEKAAMANFTGTSDEFFGQNTSKFDCVFIDGLHHYDQVRKDFENALQCLNENGIIILHDTNPADEKYTHVPRDVRGRWNGDCFRILPDLIGFDFVTCDWEANGVTVVKPGGTVIESNPITYEQFHQKRKELGNLVNRQQFEAWI